MTIAIHESALIRHFNTRKEVLRAWEERIGARFSPFRGFKMPDSRLYIEDSDFLDSIVDLIITNERHVFIRGPVGSGKSTLMSRNIVMPMATSVTMQGYIMADFTFLRSRAVFSK